MTSKKGLHVILHMLGANFFKSKDVRRHFCPYFQMVAQIFRYFTNIFIDFAQIFTRFARIFKDFARSFDKSKLLGVSLQPPSPIPLVVWGAK